MNICSVVADLIMRTDKHTEEQTEMTKLIVAFGNFANVPKKIVVRSSCDVLLQSLDISLSF